MSAFDIGCVPDGWIRGDKLQMRPAVRETASSPRQLGTVSIDSDHYMSTRSPLSLPAENEVAYVTFAPEDHERVRAWLLWWLRKD